MSGSCWVASFKGDFQNVLVGGGSGPREWGLSCEFEAETCRWTPPTPPHTPPHMPASRAAHGSSFTLVWGEADSVGDRWSGVVSGRSLQASPCGGEAWLQVSDCPPSDC